jgi:DNA polymerase-3 subunit delta
MAVNDLADLKPVYLIHGSEELLLERAVRRLRDRLAKVADLDFNLDSFDVESGATADEVLAAANTMPFMSERRLVVLRHAEKLPAADLGLLADYAKDPAPYTCLVLTAEKLAKNTRLYKAVAELGGAAEYAAPKRNEYAAEVVRMFREKGRSASLDAAEALVAAVGRDLRRLDSEADKVVAYAGEGEHVTAADIAEVVSSAAPVSVFDYLDALGSRDCSGALRLLARLVESGESVHGIHAMSVRHVRTLIGVKALMDRRVPVGQIAPAVGMAPWQVEKTARQARSFSADELTHALRAAAAAEAEMKTSPVDTRLVLERWVAGVCRRER